MSRPAGLRNGIAGLTPAATGSPTEKAAADIGALVSAVMPASKPVLIAAGRQAASLTAFMPGMPTIVAPTLTAGTLICVDANAFANVVGIDIGAAQRSGAAHGKQRAAADLYARFAADDRAPSTSMFQIAAISLRALLDINWSMRRTGAVSWMSGVGW